MHTRMTAALVWALVWATPLCAHAAGLEVREQGAVALSRSDAVTARLDDPSTVYFNPAGMAYLDGLQVSLGATLIFPEFRYSDPDGNFPDAETVNDLVTPPHAYASWRISDMFAVGLSYNVPFGLGVDWPTGYAGDHIADLSDMQVHLVNPSVAFRPIEELSIAVGIQLMPATVNIIRTFGFPTESGTIRQGGVELAGEAFGVGGNLGIMYRPLDWLYLGFFYRSRVQLDFEGDADFDVPDGVADQSVFHDQPVEASATLPDYFTFGIGFQVHETVYIEADLDVVLWSSIDQLGIEFPEDESGQLSDPVREDWQDIVTPRLGVEWTPLDGEHHALAVRAGGGFDMVPAPDHTLSPLLPDSQRAFGTVGVGYTYKPWRLGVDVGYMFSNFLKRTVDETDCQDGYCNPFPATYDSHAQLLAIDVSWQIF